MLEYLRQKLIDAGVTVPIYINFAPPFPDDVIMLRTVFGARPDVGHKYDSPRFQVLCRSKTERGAHASSYKAYQTFHEAPDMLNSLIIDIQAMQTPYFAGQDEQQRYIYVNVYQCEIVRETV